MSTLFNISSTGNFTDDLTFTRPMSTSGAVYSSGVTPLIVSINSTLSALVESEATPIKGIFLQIGSVDRNATGTFSIELKTSFLSYTFTYNVSALYKEYNKGISHAVSQYWQGFNLLDTDMSWISEFEVKFSCSSPGELLLIGTANTNFNRYFIPSTSTDYLSATPSPNICIGSYLNPVSVGGNLPATSISCNTLCSTTNVNIWNESTLTLSGSAQLYSSGADAGGAGILVSPGGTLVANPSSTIVLNNGSLIGLNSSTICLSGTEKLPYTFLNTEKPPTHVHFTTTNYTSSWKVDDTVLMTGNSAINSSELFAISFLPSISPIISFDVWGISAETHYSINSSPFNLYGVFRGAPVVNLTRDVLVKGNNASIRAEDSCNLQIYNTQLSGLGLPANTKLRAAVNLYNNNTIIDKSAFSFNLGPAIYVDTISATNFNITSNGICKNSYGIYIEGKPFIINPLASSTVSSNAIVGNDGGIAANFIDTVSINDNIISHSQYHGLILNGDIMPTNVCNLKQIDGNTLFVNNRGGYIKDINGTITNTSAFFNRSVGLYLTANTESIAISGASVSYNGDTGVLIDGDTKGSDVSITGLTANNNFNGGIKANRVHGSLSSIQLVDNLQESLFINDCNKGILNLYNFYIFNNEKSVKYNYPSLNGFNFYPTYLVNSNIDTATTEPTCITLINTKCEKFIVGNTVFSSSGPNITLSPAYNSFIEGSYIFSDCTFTSIPFDDLSTKYQTDIFSETGFVSMYDQGITGRYYKYTPAGIVESDSTVFKNNFYQISEKLTPNSSNIKLKSSKKIIFLDNFDGSVPPNLEPEYLYASVWIKKDAAWSANDPPRLVVANNPTLHINQDTVIDTHSTATTSWVQLSSITPIAAATDTRGAIELYVDCSGISGGSINVDQWEYKIVRGN